MANFLGNLGAAFQGQQNYQTWETQQEQAKLRIEAEKENLAQIKDLAADAKEERKRKSKVNQGYLDVLTGLGQPGIPPPPPSAQPPAPGQASVPMIQPQQAAQYGQRQIGPPPQGPGVVPPMPPGPGQQQGMIPPPPGGGAPMPQGGPPMPQQQGQPQGPVQPPQGPPQGQPPIPPYRTVQGASGPPQGPQGQQGPQGIPPPPQQQPQMPRPGSMTLADAARFIKAQGVTDPTTSVQILEKLTPYLDQQAQQQANQLKQQQLQQDKQTALQEKAREADQRSKDTNLSREDRRDAQREANETRKLIGLTMASIAQQNANTKSTNAGGAMAAGKDGQLAPGVEAATWDYLIKGTNPPSRGGVYSAVMKNVEQVAKDNNMSVQELTSASADVKTKLAAKRSFEVRAQNMERAENQILAEIPLAEQAIKGLNLSSIPAFQKGGLAALRQAGDPRVTTLDQSLETIFNEFEGIKTGNPGALNVSDVQNAQHNIENARTDKQLTAAIAGMRRIMNNAKSALDKTRSDTMKGINDSFKKEKSGASVPVLSNQADLAAAIKSGKLKKGDTFNDPSGAAHTVN